VFKHTHMFVATKTITIMEDAYERLAKEKRKDESFSDVIRRITNKKNDLDRFFGILSNEDANFINKTIEEGIIRSKKGDDLFTV